MIRYRFATGIHEALVDINDLTPSNRRDNSPYKCLGCEGELIANLGPSKAKHFSHKRAQACSPETYLHHLAKTVFYRIYEKCLRDGEAFHLKLPFQASCTSYQSKLGIACEKVVDKTIDLTRYFKNVELERTHEGFTPDVLLSTSDGAEVLFLEIAVTHSCEEEKIRLGKRILEIHVEREEDIDQILEKKIDATSGRVISHNFKKEILQGDVCKGSCSEVFAAFVVFTNGASRLIHRTPAELYRESRNISVSSVEIVASSRPGGIDWGHKYIKMVREAHFSGRNIRNCFLCKYFGIDGLQEVIFCKKQRVSVKSNHATKCDLYTPMKSPEACERADKINKAYLEKRSLNWRHW